MPLFGKPRPIAPTPAAEATEAAFVQQLLQSAQADAPPHATHVAWARFTTTARGVMAAGEVSGVHRVEAAQSSTVAQAPQGSAGTPTAGFTVDRVPLGTIPSSIRGAELLTKLGGGVGLKWAGAGALAGSIATVLILLATGSILVATNRAEPPPAANTAVAIARSQRLQPPGSSTAAHQEPTIIGQNALLTAPSSSFDPVAQAEVQQPLTSAPVQQAAGGRTPRQSGSTVADEVKQIDAARRALRQGAAAKALGILAHYRQRFPKGALLPESEVVTIEALAHQGATRSAQARAEAFLRRSPRDPHAPRVRRWLASLQ